MEPIKHIIDYKWDTYTKQFFLYRFFLYFIFLIFYYIDIERGIASQGYGNELYDVKGKRVKDSLFYINKSICIFIQSLFMIYEILQMHKEGCAYFEDIWNYLEATGIIIFYISAVLDIRNE